MTRPPRPPQARSDGVQWDEDSEQPLLADSEETKPFDPLDTKNLAVAVAKALLERRARPLGALPLFRGAGIYAIYYCGDFQAYRLIAQENPDARVPRWPIYIGKATPPGGRRGAFNLAPANTTALHGRLRQHAESVEGAQNLDIKDFTCRFLVIHDLWIPLAESLLISHFAPIWNRLVDGFGNHDPGSGRYNGLRPRWDVLHPGRAWAERCRTRSETSTDIMREVTAYLEGAAVPSLAALAGDITGK